MSLYFMKSSFVQTNNTITIFRNILIYLQLYYLLSVTILRIGHTIAWIQIPILLYHPNPLQQRNGVSYNTPILYKSSIRTTFTSTGVSISSNSLQIETESYSATSTLNTTTTTTSTTTTTIQQQASNNTKINPQSIAIIGTGAVGSYYGSRLWEIGHDVHYLFTNKQHYITATTKGLHISSVDGDIYIPPNIIQAYPTTKDMISSLVTKQKQQKNDTDDSSNNYGFDWIIVALKSSSLDAIPDLIVPLLINPTKTRVLVIMNGMIEYDLINLMKFKTNQKVNTAKAIDESFGSQSEPLQCCHTWYGGMALICCNRIQSCYVDHTYFGLLTAGVASTIDTSINSSTNNENTFRDLFFTTKINVAYDTLLLRGRWSKMIWNLPFNGISVAMGGITIDQIVNDSGLRQLAYNIMDETILVANTDLQVHYGTNNFIPLGDKERNAMMKLSDDMGPYKPSTMLDYINRRSMEVQYLFRTPLNRAKQLNISTPYLETIVLQIEAYQRMYNLY